MKKFILILLSFIFIYSSSNAEDFIIKAMKDEISRSIANLKLESLQNPYYIEYTLTFQNSSVLEGKLGSLIDNRNSKYAKLNVSIRVGDYKFDNTNFFDFGLSFFGSGDDEERFNGRLIPLELDYKTLRRELWLATDAAYKQASELYSKKVAALKNKVVKDTIDDFTQAEVYNLVDTLQLPQFDKSLAEEIVKKTSAVFNQYPEIFVSKSNLEYTPQRTYYANSEGRTFIKDELSTGIEITATSQSPDGMPVADYYSAYGKNLESLPSIDSLVNATKIAAEHTKQLISAKTLDESYSGPVLFTGEAACQLFAQIFAPNLVIQRDPMTESGKQESDRYTAFQSKIGGRVLPEFLSVKSVPTLDKYAETNLYGYYKIDDEGTPTQDVDLVKDGYLKTLLSSRVPTKRLKKSNGAFRSAGAMLSNTILESDEDHTKSEDELVEKMIQLCKDRELPFGIVVTKVLDQNILFTGIFPMTIGDFPILRNPAQVIATEAYKIYPDGHRELVRGSIANGLTTQSFKDILAVGNESYVLNYLASAVASPFLYGGKQYLPGSIIAPSLLFEDSEIKPLEDDFPKPPILSNPMSAK